MKVPNSRRNLDIAIQRMYGLGDEYMRARTVMANAIVGQMLPDGAVKGGSAIKLRFGESVTRFTTDLDVACASSLEEFLDELEENLHSGWNGFTGTVVPRDPASPRGVPPAYVMRPYDIKLSYNGSPWCTVPLEVGHNEIGDADDPDWGMPDDVLEMFASLRLAEPASVPIMPLHHQIAQKLHALTSPGSNRVHDLIDLQVMVTGAEIDLRRTRETCERLFSYRNQQSWPCEVVADDTWAKAYEIQCRGLDVLGGVEAAVNWTNGLIARIASAK